MTQVLFAFKHPSGEPLAGTTFTVRLQRSGFIFESDGVVVPETLTFVTGADGTILAELEPSSTPYLMVVQETGTSDDEDDCCAGSKAIRYKFYVPDSDTIVRAQDLYLAPIPNSEPWDEEALQLITDAKIASLDAADRAKASADAADVSEAAALSSANASAASATTSAQQAVRAETARDASEAFAIDSFNWSTKSAEYQVIASAAAVQSANDAAQVAEAYAYIHPAYEDFKVKYPQVVQDAIDARAAAIAAQASAVSADESEASAIDARDASEAFAIDALAARLETDADRVAAQQAAVDAGNAAQVKVDALLQDLINQNDPNKGAAILGRAVIAIASMADLLASKKDATALYEMVSYYPGVYALAAPLAGLGRNEFKWMPLVPKSQHNGVTIISSTVPWDGTQIKVADFLLGVGETQSGATGCFMATNRQQINVGQAGATGVAADDQTQSLLSAIAVCPTGGALLFPLGIFTTAVTLAVTKVMYWLGLGAVTNTSLRCTSAAFIPTVLFDGPDAGSFIGIGFWASLNNGPQLKVTNTGHMWHMDRLLFRSCPGAAFQVDNVTWDFHWGTIDILACASDTSLAPEVGAAVIIGADVNNGHFTYLRIEQAKNASIYCAGSISVNKGKADRGFIAGATQPSLIMASARGRATFTDFYLGGSSGQHEFEHRSGELKFVSSLLDRPTGVDGIGKLALNRYHNKADLISYSFFEPKTGRLFFSACTLKGAHVSVAGTIRGAITGLAANNVYVDNDVVASSSFNSGSFFTEVKLTTNNTFPSNNWVDRAFLVNATTGAKAKVISSFSTGGIRISGSRVAEFPTGSTVRLEYFANDEEFVAFSGCTFENTQPFDIPGNALAISVPTYSGATFLTSATLSGTVTTGYAGYFLVNQTTGKRWKILSHVGSVITLHYDIAAQLGTSDVYAVMAIGGYSVQTDGQFASWMYANSLKTKSMTELSRLGRTIQDIIFNMD